MKINKLLILISSAICLSSCSNFFVNVIDTMYDSYIGYPKGGELQEEIVSQQNDSGDGYQLVTDFSYNMQDVEKTIDCHPLNSIGISKFLVVPVEVKYGDYTWSKEKLNRLEQAFFGINDNNNIWESVSTYFEKSSYGKLKITGKVADTFYSSYSEKTLSTKNSKGNYVADTLIINEFRESNEYTNDKKDFDLNKDGVIDAVCFIYNVKYNNGDSPYWAWSGFKSHTANVYKPDVNAYMWASYSFINDCNDTKYGDSKINIDTHIYIHEVGHLLGLNDYYQYDEDNNFDPSGKLEMQSYNIGDHNIYSKFALGWVDPYYVKTDESVTLSLRTSSFYGDAIIINDYWNKTSMDEYLIIEYYSPFGLNYHDANYGFPRRKVGENQMYTESGFRIYHVDARLVSLQTDNKGNPVNSKYINNLEKTFCNIGASNTPSRSYLFDKEKSENFKELHLLESGGKNTFKNGGCASNSTLFKTGSSFSASDEFMFNGTKFNNGQEIGYTISIESCNANIGCVKISKIN